MTAGLVQAPILFVRCEGGDGIVARAAISSTWFGVAGPDGAIIDRTDLLAIEYVDGTGPNRQRIALVDRELTALSFLADNQEITRAQADNIFHALEEAVPAGRWFWRAGLEVAGRVLTLEGPARARLAEWVVGGGDVLPPRAT